MSEENKLIVERKKKLQALSELTALYPNDFKRNISVQELVAKYGDKAKEDLEGEDTTYLIESLELMLLMVVMSNI